MTKVKQRRVITTLAVPAPEPTSIAKAGGNAAKSPTPAKAVAPVASAPRETTTPGRPRTRRAVAARTAARAAQAEVVATARSPRQTSTAPTGRPTSAERPAAKAKRIAIPTRTSAPVRGTKEATTTRAGQRSAARRSSPSPVRQVAPGKGDRRGATARGRRPVPDKAPLPREIFIKALDPLRKCGPNTSVRHMFRVDESIGGAHAATHLVFYDRHGWYCVHGRACQAVEDVRKHGGVKQVGLDYNGRMRA